MWRSKVTAGVAAAMGAVIIPFTTQARTAKLVLIEMLARFEAARFFHTAARGKWAAMHVSGADPNAAPAGPRGANVVIHFPARPERVSLIRATNGFNHFTADCVTEIGEAIQRLERAHVIAKSCFCLEGDLRELLIATTCMRKHSLFVSRVVG